MKIIYRKEVKNKAGYVIRKDKAMPEDHSNRGIYIVKIVVKRYYIPVEAEVK